jgi:hypothetical protein
VGQAGEVAEVLQRTREVFTRRGMRPGLAATDEALAKANDPTS